MKRSNSKKRYSHYCKNFFLIICFISWSCYAQAGVFSWLKNLTNLDTFENEQDLDVSMAPGDVCSTLPPTSVGGNIWEDINFNGIRDEATVMGINGVTVNVYACDGSLLGSPITNVDGDWSLDVSAAPTCNGCQEVRIEYDNLPASSEPSRMGADNASTIAILEPGSCTGLGILIPGPCPPPFDYTTTLGDPFPLSGTLLGPGIAFVTCGVFEAIPQNERYAAGLVDIRSIATSATRPQVIPPMYHHPSWKIDSIGNTFGVDYDTLGNMYLTASSHYGAGFGWQGDKAIIRYGDIGGGASDLNAAGTVYKLDGVTGQASVFAVLPQLSFSFTQSSCEGAETDIRNTGVGLGNIVYDKIRHQFFVSNIEDGKIYRIDDNGTIIESFDPQTLTGFSADDNQPGPAPDAKPYGLAISPDGTKLFFGTHELDETPNLYSIDLSATGAFSGTEFLHGEFMGEGDLGFTFATEPSWIAISDLEFLPDGDLMIGMRTGCRGSYFNSHNHGGTFYIVEDGDSDGQFDEIVINPDIQYANDFTPDNFLVTDGSDGTANDDGYGGIGVWDKHDGTWDYLLTSADIKQEIGPHGLILFPHDFTHSGNGTTEYTLQPSAAISYFPSFIPNDIKGVGGDAVIYNACTNIRTEIGNKIWLDQNENGIQDACEPGIENIVVELYDNMGTLLATTTTDVNGNYSFSQDGMANQTWSTPNDAVSANTDYVVVFGNGQFADDALLVDGAPYLVTTNDVVGTGVNPDAVDSDVEIATGLTGGLAGLNDLPIANVTTGDGGSVVHEIDFGVTPTFDWGDLPDLANGTSTGDYETDFLNNGPIHQIVSGLYLGTSIDYEFNGQSSNLADGDGVDEDGIVFPTTIQIPLGGNIKIPFFATNTTNDTAHVEVWVDWNGDGDFDDVNEMVTDINDGNGTTAFSSFLLMNIPSDATQNEKLGMRVRLSNEDNMTPYGFAQSGEVEDYLIEIQCGNGPCLNIYSNKD